MTDMMWYESGFGKFVAWIDDHTPGHFPWAQIWIWRGFSFHFASGHGGFAIGFPMPRWLPGFVRSYQVDGPKRFWQICPWWKESDLHGIIPIMPPGLPSFMRTRRMRKR